MRGRETLGFLGLWESLHNPDFKPVEFDGFRSEAGLHAFTMSPTKWIESVNAIGIVTKAGRYGISVDRKAGIHYNVVQTLMCFLSRKYVAFERVIGIFDTDGKDAEGGDTDG